MDVVYAIHTHAHAEQVTRLVSAVRRGSDALVLVNHARGGEPLDLPALGALGRVEVMESEGGYGDWSHVQRWLDCADHLAARGVDYEWLVTLSGQDYPVMALHRSEGELLESTSDGFIEHFPVLSRAESHWPVRMARSRYWFHHRRLRELTPSQKERLHRLQALNRVQPLVRVHVSFGLSVGWRAQTPFGEGLRCYGGSAWTSLRRTAVEHVRAFRTAEPGVVEHYRRTLAPDESYLQTALVNAGRFALVDDSKRYFDFRGSRFNHPKVLGPEDVLAATGSGAHYGRKFDLRRRPDVFDELDRHVLV